ncbi:NACHT domain-containing protein [Streptomyces sp. NPDC001381]|uniref:NACHT domain-containing protein n=1 Tax=Streptomyces sp. NPDC001381 TaxID=3364567 RepID=UPI0036AF7854
MWAALREARVQRCVGLGAVALALTALTVVLAGRGGDADATSMWISAVSAFVSVCALAADLLREPAADPEAGPERRRRAADELSRAVLAQWAPEARRRRLQDPAPLDVRWTRVGPPLADHEHNVRPGRPVPAPRDGDQRLDRIAGTFRDIPSRRLVVLGGPGAGKTVLALRFVLDLLGTRRSTDPVPVLLPLASWEPGAVGLRAWLAERLAAEYRPLAAVRGGRTLARELLDEGLVLPVLDGFDEIPRESHARALSRLNAELDERLPVMLTCRDEDWGRALGEAGGDVLTAAEVIRLRPLDPETAREYLESTARPIGGTRPNGRPVTVWTAVLDAPTAPLTAVLRSPLMVALARTVYGDTSRDPSELTEPDRFPSATAVEGHLLDSFVPAAFADEDGIWRPDAAHRWLRCLARLPSGARATWQLGWWELPAAMPPWLRVLGPAGSALLATAAVLVPLARYGGGVVGNWDSVLSAVLNFAGLLAGLCFGLALMLPAEPAAPPGPRQLTRMALTMTGAATVLALVTGWCVPPLVSARLGAVITPRPAWFLNGCVFGLVLSLMFAVGGLPRRPLPLSLPWTGSPSGPRAVRALGGVILFAGLASYGYFRAAVPAMTCCLAGLLLTLAGQPRRGARGVEPYAGPAAVLRGFARGLGRGLLACTLIGVCAGAVVGGVTGAFAAYEIHRPAGARTTAGAEVDGWRLGMTDGRRSVESVRPRRVELVSRTALARPFAVHQGARISWDERRGTYEGTVRIQARGDRWVLVWRGTPQSWRGRAVDAHNLVVALPRDVELWLVHRGTGAVVRDAVEPFVAFGVLVGAIGGCASGVCLALNTPADTIRAADPPSTLRTDRAATLARSAVAALVAGGGCLAFISATGRGTTLGTMHTEVWVPVGTSALALSAWGRLGTARIWLAVTGRAPWRLMRFLEDAHRRGVLRHSGALYEFRHVRLQERLAARTTEETAAGRPDGRAPAPRPRDSPGRHQPQP